MNQQVLCLLILQLPMTLSTTDYSSANCMTWRKTSIWQSWSNCFWKTDASMLSWMANKAGGGNNGMAFPRVASLLPCCSASITRNKKLHLRWWPWHSSSESQHRWHRSYSVLQNLTKYYNDNQLKANPAKTQVSLFHLRNREVGRKLSLTWNGVDLKHCDFPVYLGVTLDRTLSYTLKKWKEKWEQGTTSSINSQTHHGVPILPPCELLPLHSAIQLQNMPVLCGKDHPMQRKLTPPLSSCRCITGCLRPTNVDSL